MRVRVLVAPPPKRLVRAGRVGKVQTIDTFERVAYPLEQAQLFLDDGVRHGVYSLPTSAQEEWV